jgi:hypothetical protein
VADDSFHKDDKDKSQGASRADRAGLVEIVIDAALRSLTSQVAALYDQLKSATEEERRERREHQARELYWNKTRAQAAIGFSVVGLLLSALTLGVLYRMLGVYRAQTTIIATQAAILSKQREINEKTLAAMQAQADAARLAAESSKIQADAAVVSAQTARDTLRITEAADVNLAAIECSPPSALSLNTTMTLHYRNSGRTRADNFESVFFLGIPPAKPGEPAGRVHDASVGAGASVQSVSAGTVGDLLSRNPAGAPPEQTFQKIVAGQLQFGVWGYVQYTDVLNEPHRKHFEYIWDRNFPNACLFTVAGTSGQ